VETAHAFELAGGKPERVHVNRLLESPRLLSEFRFCAFPEDLVTATTLPRGEFWGIKFDTIWPT